MKSQLLFFILKYVHMGNKISSIRLSGTTYPISDSGATKVVEITQASYDSLPASAKTANIMYIITDAQAVDISGKQDISGMTAYTEVSAFTAHSGDSTIHVTTAQTAAWNAKSDFSGSYNDLIDKPTIPTSASQLTNDAGYATSGYVDSVVSGKIDSESAVTLSTDQSITGEKTFVGEKRIKFQQTSNTSKPGFTLYTSGGTTGAYELGSFEFRPSTVSGRPLLYFGHYRSNVAVSNNIPQTYIGFRQYDYENAAAYHYLLPLPENAKTPFSLTSSFKDYYAPIGFKVDSGGTMVTSDNTGVVDLSSYFSGGGVDSGTVQTMINESISGKADSSSLATVATSGDYDDLLNKPTIPTVPTSNTAFTNDAGYITSNDITGKTDTSAFTAHTGDTTIHVTTAQTASWNAKQNALTIDSTVTSGSTNPVQGGAVYTQLGGLKLQQITQSAYDALTTKDNSTLYIIVN